MVCNKYEPEFTGEPHRRVWVRVVTGVISPTLQQAVNTFPLCFCIGLKSSSGGRHSPDLQTSVVSEVHLSLEWKHFRLFSF
jgi:hypothetical protein